MELLQENICDDPRGDLRPFGIRRPPSHRGQRLLPVPVQGQPPGIRMAARLGDHCPEWQSDHAAVGYRAGARLVFDSATRPTAARHQCQQSQSVLQQHRFVRAVQRDTHRRCACHPGLCSDTKRGLRCPVHVQRHTEYPGGSTNPIVAGSCHPGSAGRDSLTAPKFVNTDFSVVKNTKITERFNLQFRVEMFDLFNHPNFGDPVNTVTSSAFGKILATRFPVGDFGSARQTQFALKLIF
jgi:hypothetical protein